MKKLRLLLFLSIFFSIATLSGCNQQEVPKTEVNLSPLEIAKAIMDTQSELPPMSPLKSEDKEFSEYLTKYYQVDADAVQDGILFYADDGMQASEIAVLVLKDESDTADIEKSLLDYIDSRTGSFAGYAPIQAALLKNAVVAVNGRYVALLICKNPEKAQNAFLGCFGEAQGRATSAASQNPKKTASSASAPQTVPPSEPASQTVSPAKSTLSTASSVVPPSEPVTQAATPPEPSTQIISPTEPTPEDQEPVEDAYNAAAVLSAWMSGDYSSLSDKNRSILEACSLVIDQIITTNMTDYQKELAIHDWIINWGDYDEAANSHAPDAKPDPDNDNPYGLLIHQKAICRGYSTTFQLFMDLLGIECLTVDGTAHNGTAEHAWNMVQLDGEWYCVDVTWDDPTDGSPNRLFFNVTSKFLRDRDHQWDNEGIPEATATKYRRYP